MKRDFLSILDLTPDEVSHLISKAKKMKRQWAENALPQSMRGKVLGLIFVKPSTRTRVSFEAAMYRLGGHCIFMTAQDTQISRDEPLADTARVLSRYMDLLAVRTFAHSDVEELARHATIPVINGLTDTFHPCQIMSDLLTIEEKRGHLQDLKVAWLGDGNNVAHSWINAAALLGFGITLACPDGYEPEESVLRKARSLGRGELRLVKDPLEAVASADIIYTDVWTSMGQEEEKAQRLKAFQPYQVNENLLAQAPPHAMIMHCLPAHRGEEITEGALEGPQSIVFDQAENRMHLQMALMEWLMTGQ